MALPSILVAGRNQVWNYHSQSPSWAQSSDSYAFSQLAYGEFINLQDEGNTLLANTTHGLYYSTNGGRSWVKR